MSKYVAVLDDQQTPLFHTTDSLNDTIDVYFRTLFYQGEPN
jgi:hypothetical protein